MIARLLKFQLCCKNTVFVSAQNAICVCVCVFRISKCFDILGMKTGPVNDFLQCVHADCAACWLANGTCAQHLAIYTCHSVTAFQ